MKVLLIKLSSLGDIVHAGAAVRYLREHYKKPLELHWLVNDDLAELVEATGMADKVIPFDRNAWNHARNIFSNMKGFLKKIGDLKKEKYDAAVDLQCLFRSSIIAFLSRIPRRAGFDRTREGASLFLNELAETKDKGFHAVEENMAVIAEVFGIKEPEDPRKYAFQLDVPHEKAEKVLQMMKSRNIQPGKLVLINPNSRWETKKWGRDQYKAFIQKLLKETEYTVAVIGSKGEREDCSSFESMGDRVHNMAGETDLLELYLLMKNARLLITNDSGPMHLASAAGTRTLSIFGPTSPERTGPFWESHVIRSEASCSPCFRKKCPLMNTENMRCMKEISVDQVYREVKKLLS